MSAARAQPVRLRPSLLVVMPLLAACSPPPGFDRLRPFTLRLWEDMRDNVVGLMEYDDARLGCLSLASDFTADMNGVAPVAVDAGGGFSLHCLMPLVEVPRPEGAAERATLTITSGDDRVVVEVDGMGSKLGGQLLVAPGAVVRPGETVQIALAPGFNDLQWPASADQRVDGVDQTEKIPLVASTGDGVVVLRLSGSLPPGPTHVHAVAARTPVIARCDGPNACRWLDANVVPVTLDVAFEVSR
jgi:hypothetical protein